jgi:hypothetical protein
MHSLPFGPTVPYRESIERISFRSVWNSSNVKSGGPEVGAFGHSSTENATTLTALSGVEDIARIVVHGARCRKQAISQACAVCSPKTESMSVMEMFRQLTFNPLPTSEIRPRKFNDFVGWKLLITARSRQTSDQL